MKLGVTLDILNQKATPAFYADTLANRPAAGFTGRVFISTDTLDLYRDTGTTWVLLSPSSTGTITGSGAAGQVTYFSAASSITGSNNLFWDSVNSHLGIQTITPDCALDVNHNGTFVAKFNNTSSANTLIGIYNADNPQWLIGSNNVANNLTFYDATNFPTLVATTTMKTDGTTYIGGQTTGSGRLNVYSATGDNGIQISGPTAPSLRIDNAPTGATKRIGLGIATAVNNFIQGAVDRDMCIFNGSTTASPMLFGIYDTTNVQEAARISASRNFLVGTTVDSGDKFQVASGSVKIVTTPFSPTGRGFFGTSSNHPLGIIANGGEKLTIDTNGNIGIGINTPSYLLDVRGNNAITQIKTTGTTGSTYSALLISSPAMTWNIINDDNGGGGKLRFYNDFLVADALNIMKGTNNVLIGTTTDNGNKLRVNGQTQTNRLSYNSSLQSTTIINFGPGNQSNIVIPTEFPELTNLTGNVWGITGTMVIFIAAQAESVQFSISRNTGGGWSAGTIALSSSTAGAALTSVTGSGTTLTLNFNTTVYFSCVLTAIIS